MKKFVMTLLLIGIALMSSHAYAASSAVAWEEVFEKSSLPEIALLIGDDTKTPWPKIISVQAAEKLSKKERKAQADSFKLAEMLFEKIKDYEKGIDTEDTENLGSLIETYSSLGRGLRAKGGYVNQLLADSVNRSALTRIAFFLVHNQKSHQQAKRMLDKMSLPAFSKEEFIRLLVEEGVLEENDKRIEDIRKEKYEIPTYEILGDNVKKVLSRVGEGMGKTSHLLRQSDFPVLLMRMSYTDVFALVHLSGLVEFLKRGGRYDDLDLRDITKFKQIMGGTERQFKYDSTGNNQVFAGDIKMLFDVLKETPQKFHFYTIAIE